MLYNIIVNKYIISIIQYDDYYRDFHFRKIKTSPCRAETLAKRARAVQRLKLNEPRPSRDFSQMSRDFSKTIPS